MKKITSSYIDDDGEIKRRPIDLKRLLNLSILKYLNKARAVGFWRLPEIRCDTDTIPDFIALYREKSQYNKTENTAVCFYLYDNEFDGKNGLFQAIYFNDIRRLEYFKLRFKNVKFLITPDYSIFGDLPPLENLIRLWKARIVSLWFAMELNAIVIPNASYVNEQEFDFYFLGLENCSTIAFSTKSHVHNLRERRLCKKAIKYITDNFKRLKNIIVYSACGNNENCLRLFQYPISKGIKVFIPNNTLLERNRKNWRQNHGMR